MNMSKQHFLKVALGYIIFEVIFYLIIPFCALQLNPLLWVDDYRFGFSVMTIFVLVVAIIIYIAIKVESNRSIENREDDPHS